MTTEFAPQGLEDFNYWLQSDPDVAEKIKALVQSIKQTPFKGLGKPEPLKHSYKGYWSRRITGEHRLVYKISGTKDVDQKCIIIQCRFHYA